MNDVYIIYKKKYVYIIRILTAVEMMTPFATVSNELNISIGLQILIFIFFYVFLSEISVYFNHTKMRIYTVGLYITYKI